MEKIIVGIVVMLYGIGSYYTGMCTNQNQIEHRVLTYDVKTDCYSAKDMDYILFGESQE